MMMEFTLFDQESNTKLRLLHMLFKKGDWYTIEELVTDSRYDRNTVLKYSRILQEEIATVTFLDSKATLDRSKTQGLRFQGDKISYRDVVSQLVGNSFSFSLLRDLFLKKEVSIDQFSAEHFVSESSIRRKLTQLNKSFEPHGFSFRTVRRQIRSEGSETQLRYYGYIFFWDIYRGVSWPFKAVSEEKITHVINDEISALSRLKHVSIAQWSYMIALNLTRFSMGYQLEKSDIPEYAHDLNQTFYHSGPTLAAAMKEAFNFSIIEIDFLVLLFQIGTHFFLIDDLFERAMNFHQTRQTLVFELYQLYLSVLQPDLEALNEEDQLLYKSLILATFMRSALFPTYEMTVSSYDYFAFFSSKFPALVHEMVTQLERMQRHTDFDLIKIKTFLVPRMCEAYALIGRLTDFDTPIRIKLETDLPIVLERILGNQLTAALSTFYSISVISTTRFLEEPYDLVVASTVSATLKQLRDVPIVVINPEINEIDLANIAKAIEQLRAQKKNHDNLTGGMLP